MKTCLFAGTFDPFTIGHLQIVNKALETFDKVVVAIGENDEKKPYFSLEERLKIISAIFENQKRVTVTFFKGYLVDFMAKNGLIYNVRGIRNGKDFEYESRMEEFNSKRYPSLITLYYPVDSKVQEVSSTLVRSVMEKGGDLSSLIPEKGLEILNSILKESAKSTK